jgi:glycosyltransferase involved in cell wall biosynthesis
MSAAAGDRFCAVIPAYREQGRIGAVVRRVRQFCPDVIVVDDGSPDGTAEEAREAGATVLRHATNQGKGVALVSGIRLAAERGYAFLVTLDADGQHDPADIPALVAAHRRTGAPVVVGNRMGDPRTMPFVRKATNYIMSWLLSRKMGQRVPDTQTGYRLYRTDAILAATQRATAPRFAAESEVLLELAARGARIAAAPIRVIYGDERSKIHPIKDAVRFLRMLRDFDRRKRQAAKP